ncbi:MAG: tRNA pseudouridine(55) synthase TruB [Pseudomonadota bacterium]|nr:tRNA pseudouridine(55) synthase TruB [Pseudomonadota bacterium]
MNGILLLDKPTGISSFKAIYQVRKLLDIKKIGHCGTLDPLATGMLPIMVNEATKYSQYIISSDKSYIVEMTLGFTSDTFDTEGKVVQHDEFNVDLKKIEETLDQFRGEQEQLPPKYSALKVNGSRAYDLARKGIEFELTKRKINIKKLTLLNLEKNVISLEVECSKGTYIRSLVHDIGQRLGCGAIMSRLHRQWVSPFNKNTMYPIDLINETKLIKIESIFKQSIQLNDKDILKIQFGQSVPFNQPITFNKNEPIAIHTMCNNFIGIGIIENNAIRAKRLLSN